MEELIPNLFPFVTAKGYSHPILFYFISWSGGECRLRRKVSRGQKFEAQERLLKAGSREQFPNTISPKCDFQQNSWPI